MTNLIPNRIIKSVAAGFLALALIASFAPFLKTGDAEAHTSFWSGYHYTRVANCMTGAYYIKMFDIAPPVMFATRNDAKSYQWVGWRPRVGHFNNGVWQDLAVGQWQTAWAYDTQAASFTRQSLVAPGGYAQRMVKIDFAFTNTTTGEFVEFNTHDAAVNTVTWNVSLQRYVVTSGTGC